MRKRSRTILIVFIAVVALTSTVFGVKRWITTKLPEQFGINRVAVTLTPDSIFLRLRVLVPDNNLASLLLDSLGYRVLFDTVQFSSGMKKFGNEVADTLIDLPLGMDKEKLFSTIKKMQVKDSTWLNIRLEPYLRLPGKGTDKIPFTINKRMRVPIPPEVAVEDIDLDKFGLHEASLRATLQVINFNAFEFIILGGDLSLDFPGLFDGALSVTEPVHLKNYDTTAIETAVKLGEMKTARTAWNFAFKKDEMEYSLYGKLYISTMDEPHDTIEVILRSNKNTFPKKKET